MFFNPYLKTQGVKVQQCSLVNLKVVLKPALLQTCKRQIRNSQICNSIIRYFFPTITFFIRNYSTATFPHPQFFLICNFLTCNFKYLQHASKSNDQLKRKSIRKSVICNFFLSATSFICDFSSSATFLNLQLFLIGNFFFVSSLGGEVLAHKTVRD